MFGNNEYQNMNILIFWKICWVFYKQTNIYVELKKEA